MRNNQFQKRLCVIGAAGLTCFWAFNVPTWASEDVLWGDINKDGKVDKEDVALLAKSYVDLSVNIDIQCGDLNNDGKINSTDVSILANFIKEQVCVEKDREALIALYNSLGGAEWMNQENWCTNRPLNEWYGVNTNENGRVRDLYLSYNNLNGTVTDSIYLLTELNSLDLAGNCTYNGNYGLYYGILGISDKIGELTNLQSLNLSNLYTLREIPSKINNLETLTSLNISSAGASAYGCDVPNFDKLTKLTTLDLSGLEKLKVLPDWVFNNKELRRLSLGYNRLESLDPRIFNFENLDYLDCEWGTIGGELSEEIGNLKDLSRLYLSHNQIEGNLPIALSKMQNLVDLRVAYNNMSGVVPQEIQDCPNWQKWNPEENILPQNIGKLYLSQEEIDNYNKIVEEEKAALVAIYNATGGENWVRNDNWCSDEPLDSWYGVTIGESGRVSRLDLSNRIYSDYGGFSEESNNLVGSLPDELCNLLDLEWLSIRDSKELTGSLPNSIGNLKKLSWLTITNCNLTGTIPISLGECKSLYNVELYRNNLEGTLPEGLFNIETLRYFSVFYNNLSGTIPSTIGNSLSLESFMIDGNQITGEIPDNFFNLRNLYSLGLSKNELTGQISENIAKLRKVRDVYLDNNNLMGNIPEKLSELTNCTYFGCYGNKMSGVIPSEVVNSEMWNSWCPDSIMLQQEGYGLTIDSTQIALPDFSDDGKVTILQQHTKGNGFAVVFMGDAYLDKDSVQYETDMRNSMEYYFSREPLKSLRDYYDVYSVRTVSKSRVLGCDYGDGITFIPGGGTALESYQQIFSTIVGGDDSKCIEYLKKALPDFDESTQQAEIVVIINIPDYGGTCYMYSDKFSIAYCTRQDGAIALQENVLHEAAGHGFGFLADEYYYDYNPFIPEEEIQRVKDVQQNSGWYMNIDFTPDPTAVRWNPFLSDPRYNDEELGVYEGGYTYVSGVYRPTLNSIMRYNMSGEFNAPSREAIYKRLMSATIDGWMYDYETFVAFDQSHPRSSAPGVKSGTARYSAPPVIRNYSSHEIGRHVAEEKAKRQAKTQDYNPELIPILYERDGKIYEKIGNRVRVMNKE